MKSKDALLAGLAALLPVAAGAHGNPATGLGAAAFSPPHEGVLTRTVWRYLPDGAQIVVTRRYTVRFEATTLGFSLDGELIEAKVDAPPELAAFAELERTRPDNTMFPIVLDRTGAILSDGKPPSPETARRAAALIGTSLSAAPLDPKVRREAAAQIPRLFAGNSAAVAVPGDLFQPHPGQRNEVRKVALPGGIEGQVEVAMRVDAPIPGAMPHEVERVVTTRLAGTTRVSRELWSFTPH